MDKYINWELYDAPPEGFVLDRKTGSPLFGYDFFEPVKLIFVFDYQPFVKTAFTTDYLSDAFRMFQRFSEIVRCFYRRKIYNAYENLWLKI